MQKKEKTGCENYGFSPLLADNMREKGIDLQLTRRILDNYNAGEYEHFQPVKAIGIPQVDGKRVLDLTGDFKIQVNLQAAQARLEQWGINVNLQEFCKTYGEKGVFDKRALARVGVLLYPCLAYGILNGGSASSYLDFKKNQAFNP